MVLVLYFSLFPTLIFSYRYELAACAIFQNDAPYLKEWIEFHKLVGVQHFYLYNNLSTDGYLKVLEPYIVRGEVDLMQWPYESQDVTQWNGIQCAAYSHAIELTRSQVKWLAVMDTDEFIFPLHTDSLAQFLSNYEEFGGISINWQCFGTSHIPKLPQNKLMIELLTYKQPTYNVGHCYVKSIVRPERVSYFHDPHFAVYLPGYFQVNSDKSSFSGSIAESVVIDKIRINHYWSRDEDFFLRVKVARRAKWGQDTAKALQWVERFNQEYDNSIQRFIPQLKKNIKESL